MTEKEYEQLRGYQTDSGNKNSNMNHLYENDEPRDGYFAYFKLRCLICFVLFLGIIALDQQLNIKANKKVQQAISLLNKEDITAEECFQIIK